jgi:hypothetical protein
MSGGILAQQFCPNLTVAHNQWLVAEFGYKVVQMVLASSKKFISQSEVQQAVANGTIDCSVEYVSIRSGYTIHSRRT